MFGSIPYGATASGAKIFLPNDTDSEYSLSISDIKGFNSVAQNWSVGMSVTGPTNVTVDGRTYKQYIISDTDTAGQGKNAYKVTISR